ncbi:uncharacterized protein, partial [Primulina eburnea]|uniref:uncharacterized protein n=1 Tax=Primulina eburnea TaxID=1245227 RepID=UPI003C6C1084
MRYRWWLELVKEYDCEISYHSGKTNVVADALSRKVAIIAQMSVQRLLQSEIQRFGLEVYHNGRAPKLSNLTVQSSLLDQIHKGQSSDEQLQKWRLKDEAKGNVLYIVSDGIVKYRGRMWVPSVDSIREDILTEEHESSYSIHPGGTKMYKGEGRALEASRDASKWKWENITMDFVVGLP